MHSRACAPWGCSSGRLPTHTPAVAVLAHRQAARTRAAAHAASSQACHRPTEPVSYAPASPTRRSVLWQKQLTRGSMAPGAQCLPPAAAATSGRSGGCPAVAPHAHHLQHGSSSFAGTSLPRQRDRPQQRRAAAVAAGRPVAVAAPPAPAAATTDRFDQADWCVQFAAGSCYNVSSTCMACHVFLHSRTMHRLQSLSAARRPSHLVCPPAERHSRSQVTPASLLPNRPASGPSHAQGRVPERLPQLPPRAVVLDRRQHGGGNHPF